MSESGKRHAHEYCSARFAIHLPGAVMPDCGVPTEANTRAVDNPPTKAVTRSKSFWHEPHCSHTHHQ